MPPKRGGRGGGLGSALLKQQKRDRNAKKYQSAGTGFGVADIKSSSNALRSVTHVSSLEEFVANAVMSDRQFVAERAANMTLLGPDGQRHGESPMQATGPAVKPLRIPRRPKWTTDMTKEELESSEMRAFLEWRAALARLEESESRMSVTPFEKNLEVWKQLWRVVERSDLLIQIVDARNPLLYRCPDLEEYVKEVDETKELLILVNKADFLPQHFRKAWSEYFDSVGVSYLFFSAKLEQERIDAAERDMTLTASGLTKLEEVLNESPDALLDQLAHTVTDEDEDHSGDGDDIVDEDEADELVEGEATDSEHDGHPSALNEREKWSIMGREELIDFLVSKQKELVQPEESEHTEDEETDGEYEDSAMPLRPLVVGMVGYPNVGKSSTINALLGASTLAHGMKRVSVGSTPGKTKHFQTLMLCPQVTLCDCPGLVFPSFVNSSAEMVCNGILPIAHLRDHMGPMKLVCQRIPRQVFADTYGLKPLQESHLLYVPPHALLDVYCHSRGFMASYHAGYDHSRGARLMLMDYMNGKLLYCVPPPTQPSLNLYQDILDEAAASGLDTSLPATTASVTASVAASGKVNNVLAVPDTSALFHIPVPKHKSEKVSVKLSRHKARKGERDPDPYGTQAQADPLSAMLAEDAELGMMAAADAAKRRDDAVTKQVIGTGKGRANASTFTRVHRPYSEV